MPPEMLRDGISTEKTDVVGCLKMVRAIDIHLFQIILNIKVSAINNMTQTVQ